MGRPSFDVPVDRSALFHSQVVRIHDNLCQRTDRALSPLTDPLPFHEVCLPRRGVWVRHLEGRDLPVTPGTVHFLNRGEVHAVSHPRGCGDRNTGLLVEERVLQDLVGDVDPAALDRSGLPFSSEQSEVSNEVLLLHGRLIGHLREPGRGHELLAEELALSIVRAALVARRDVRPPKRSTPWRTRRRHEALVADTQTFLGLHFAERLCLARVAAAVGSSPHHLCRVFRERTGASIHQHLLRLRLHAALERIVGGQDLADVAAATGFADRSHLSRRFRGAFEVPPSALRGVGRRNRSRRLRGA